MKVVKYREYGSPAVLILEDIEKPLPRDNEMLVKVKASTVTSGTIWARKGAHPDSKFFSLVLRLFFGLLKPRKEILGYEFAGVVEEVGSKVSAYKAGDEVFGTTTGLKSGAYAEYVCVPESWKQGVVAKKPASLTFEEAAALPIGAMTALHLLRKRKWKGGEKVLIYGASGSVGTYAVQLCRHFGAHVTGVCSTANLELVSSLGAESVVDYKKEDFTKGVETYDVVFDAVGKIKRKMCSSVLGEEGIFLSVSSPTTETDEKLMTLISLVEKKEIAPYIDKVYSLETIAKAHEYADTGHKKGNLVITVDN